jgi:hypothetical protein
LSHQADNSADAGFQGHALCADPLAGIETMHMIRKGQLGCANGKVASAAEQFGSVAIRR